MRHRHPGGGDRVRHRSPVELTTAVRAGVACTAVLLLAACSGDEPDDGAAPSPATSSSAAATSSAAPSSAAASSSTSAAPQAASGFCADALALLDGLGSAFTDQAGPASVRSAFEETAEGFRRVEPPPEIADDWAALGEGLDAYATALADLDENDPGSVEAFQRRTGELQGELTGAATGVESYLAAECGPAGEPSASDGG